jgi:hypothetical protein
MERKITVLSNKGTNTAVINSTASTLGELKTEMIAAGIDYNGMSIFEGVSKTELMDDSSILPSNLPYKGQVTNDLVILLSVKDKKITSGASAREAAYEAVKANNLQNAVKAKFNRNFTRVSTVDLVEFVAANTKSIKATVPTHTPVKEDTVKSELNPLEALMAGFAILVESLYEDGVIDDGVTNRIDAVCGGRFIKETPAVKEEPKVESPYSKEETANMFDFLKKK